MTERIPYTFAVLQYVHDVTCRESINIGVAMLAPGERILKFEIRHQIGRVKAAFPDLDRDVFRDEVAAVRRVLARKQGLLSKDDLCLEGRDASAKSVVVELFPNFASSFQWTLDGGGLTRDLEAEFDRLKSRMLERYLGEKSRDRKDDNAVWAPIRDALHEAHCDMGFEEKTVASAQDEITFKHAWKNGDWHVYEPVSLDYADSDGVKDRARRLRGQLDAVFSGKDIGLALNVIIGVPREPLHKAELQSALDAASAIIKGAAVCPRIWFDETDGAALVDEILREASAHRAHIEAAAEEASD
jgi:hypothetical protein